MPAGVNSLGPVPRGALRNGLSRGWRVRRAIAQATAGCRAGAAFQLSAVRALFLAGHGRAAALSVAEMSAMG